MRYAKLNSGTLEYAPSTVTVGQTHYNPTPASWLEEHGYLPVIETAYPQDGKYYVGSWVEQDGNIVRVWMEEEAPETPATDTEVLNAMTGVGENG